MRGFPIRFSRPSSHWGRLLAANAAALVSAAFGFCQSITIDVSSPGAELPGVAIGGDDLTELFDLAIAREQELRSFEGRAIVARVGYLGVADALQVTVAADGASASLYIPSTGFFTTFDAISPEQLQGEVEGFLRSEGSSALAAFRREINKRSPAGVTDGNPLATTALLSRALYRGLLDSGLSLPAKGSVDLSMVAESGSWSARSLGGRTFSLEARSVVRLGRRVRWSAQLPLEYRSVGGADVWGGSLSSWLTWDLLGPKTGGKFSWYGGPALGVALRGSEQLAAGGAAYTAGMGTVAAIEVGKSGRLAFAAQLTDYGGIPVDYEGFELDSQVDQSIAELGVHYSDRWRRVRYRASLSGAEFLRDAAEQRYGSIRIAVSTELGRAMEGTFEVAHTLSDEFESTSARVRVRW